MTFNPYREWFGISTDTHPNYYELIGVSNFESCHNLIDEAVMERVSFLQDISNGIRRKEAQRILNEIAQAVVCLKDADKKRAYDQSLLHSQTNETKGESPIKMAKAMVAPVGESHAIKVATAPTHVKPSSQNGKRNWHQVLTWTSIAVFLALLLGTAYYFTTTPNRTEKVAGGLGSANNHDVINGQTEVDSPAGNTVNQNNGAQPPSQSSNLISKPSPKATTSDQAIKNGIRRHRILVCGKQTYILEQDGTRSWSHPAATRDGFVLPDDRILLVLSKSKKHRGGAVVFVNQANGREVMLWKGTQSEVNSVQPTDDGTFVITEAGKNPRLLEIDKNGKVLLKFPLRCQKKNHHMQTRMARKLDDGTFLVPHLFNFAVFHYSESGKVLAKFDTTVPGDAKHEIHSWPFTAIRHGDGHTLACLTHSNRVVDFDSAGNVVWQLTNDDLPGDWLQDPCGAQVLPNGNIVIASYAAGRNDPMVPKLFEVTPDKKVVWKFVDGQKIGVHHFQILSTNGERIMNPAK